MESSFTGVDPSGGRAANTRTFDDMKEPAQWDDMKPTPARKEPKDEPWSCPICFMWFDAPVCPPCKHTFCVGCLDSVVKAAAQRQRRSNDSGPVAPACPICREVFKPDAVKVDSRVFEEMLRAKVNCPNGGKCSAQICPLRWKKHQEECPSATIPCTHYAVGCVWKGAREDLRTHVECCAYEKIKGLVPRLSSALKQIHTQVHHLEARILAQNTVVANTRAVLVHQRRRGAVFPLVYALLWRPSDWRRYSYLSPGDILSNATLTCVAPILLVCLWGAGLFGGGSGALLEERVACLACVAVLTYVMFLEYDNGSPWHEVLYPCLLQGKLAIGKVLLENATRLVVYCAIKGLPPWKRALAMVLLVAPSFYPSIVEVVHRFQVLAKNAQNQAQRAHAQAALPPVEMLLPSTVKVHTTVLHGVVRAAAMLMCGHKAVLVGEALTKVGVVVLSAVQGPETFDALLNRVWVNMSEGIASDDKGRLRKRHDTIFREMKSPLPSVMYRQRKGLIFPTSTALFAAILYYFRGSLQMIAYSRLVLTALDSSHFWLELHVGRLVMKSLKHSTRANQDAAHAENPGRDLLRSRLLLLWTVSGSIFFVLILFTS